MRFLNRVARWSLVLIGFAHPHRPADAQLRIVNYNTANSGDGSSPVTPRAGMETLLEAIGNEVRIGIAQADRRIGVAGAAVLVDDHGGDRGRAQRHLWRWHLCAVVCRREYLRSRSRRSDLQHADRATDWLPCPIGDVSGTGASRQPMRYQLRPWVTIPPPIFFFTTATTTPPAPAGGTSKRNSRRTTPMGWGRRERHLRGRLQHRLVVGTDVPDAAGGR